MINNTIEGEYNLFRKHILELPFDEINGIEIGVLNGHTSAFLLSLSEKIKLIGIDPIIPDSMEKSLVGSVEQIELNTKMFGERFSFMQYYSSYAVKVFHPNSVHFIFIDGSHHYEDVMQDYDLYFDKIVTGGLIFFHDSRMNRGGANFHVGSSKFVDEVIANDRRVKLIGEAYSLTCFVKL
jgi:hypothetical protein